jgi:hypothetical protein
MSFERGSTLANPIPNQVQVYLPLILAWKYVPADEDRAQPSNTLLGMRQNVYCRPDIVAVTVPEV